MKLIVMFLQLPFIEDLALNVQMLHIKSHRVQSSMFKHARSNDLGLTFTPFKKVLVRSWMLPIVHILWIGLGGVFRKDRTDQSSIARSKRTQDPVLSVNQSGVVDRRQTM
jgi:hypothetical protein